MSSHPPQLLTPLPPSPSASLSSLSSTSSFDHTAPAPDEEGDTPRMLGLRELLAMRKREKAASKQASGLPAFTPGPGEGGGGGGVQLLRAVGQEDLPFATDVVVKGWKVVGGKSWTDVARVGAYVVYEIEVTLRPGGTITILRRYSEFYNLRKDLKRYYPHLASTIPPLPSRAHITKFDEKFLAQRQPRLQRFLRGVMLHPDIGRGGPGSLIGRWVLDHGHPSSSPGSTMSIRGT